jgi:hypothetical protein
MKLKIVFHEESRAWKLGLVLTTLVNVKVVQHGSHFVAAAPDPQKPERPGCL